MLTILLYLLDLNKWTYVNHHTVSLTLHDTRKVPIARHTWGTWDCCPQCPDSVCHGQCHSPSIKHNEKMITTFKSTGESRFGCSDPCIESCSAHAISVVPMLSPTLSPLHLCGPHVVPRLSLSSPCGPHIIFMVLLWSPCHLCGPHVVPTLSPCCLHHPHIISMVLLWSPCHLCGAHVVLTLSPCFPCHPHIIPILSPSSPHLHGLHVILISSSFIEFLLFPGVPLQGVGWVGVKWGFGDNVGMMGMWRPRDDMGDHTTIMINMLAAICNFSTCACVFMCMDVGHPHAPRYPTTHLPLLKGSGGSNQ